MHNGISTTAALSIREQDLNPFPVIDRLELSMPANALVLDRIELSQAWRSDLPPVADDPVWSSLVWQPFESGAIALPAGRYVQLRTTLQADPP